MADEWEQARSLTLARIREVWIIVFFTQWLFLNFVFSNVLCLESRFYFFLSLFDSRRHVSFRIVTREIGTAWHSVLSDNRGTSGWETFFRQLSGSCHVTQTYLREEVAVEACRFSEVTWTCFLSACWVSEHRYCHYPLCKAAAGTSAEIMQRIRAYNGLDFQS